MTTAQEAYNQIYDRIPYDERIHTTDESSEIVEAALEWIKMQNADNDYMHNLITICNSEYIDYKGMGIAASLIPTYYRSLKTKEEEKEEKVESEFVGKVNDKIEIEVTLIKKFSYDTIYGTTYIYKFEDQSGNTLVWKTGSKELKENEKYKVKGTIKEHEEYRGEKQTQLTRCKVESL